MHRAIKKQRGQLLATASAIVLMMSVCGAGGANASDADRPPLWLQLGWQYEGTGNLGDVFAIPFASGLAADGFPSPYGIQRRMGYSYGAEAGLSFRPDNSDWTFSASVRYGRAHGHTKVHQQTAPLSSPISALVTRSGSTLFRFHTQSEHPRADRYEDARASNSETHAIIDFQAGKDVGLGIGTQSSSQLNFGLRFAQFRSHSGINIAADPDFQFKPHEQVFQITPHEFFHFILPSEYFHHDGVIGNAERSFKGLGPSISWNAAAAMVGNARDGELDFDWGFNAAILFGQQKTKIQHKTSSKLFNYNNFYGTPGINMTHGPSERSRRVIVPNVGAFAGISYRFTDAELKLGYRTDFFLNAIDGGIDTRHDITRSFYGPFASLSVGLGGSD